MIDHSPTPWQVDSHGDVLDAAGVVQLHADDSHPSVLKQIVRCVNLHDELVKRLAAIEWAGGGSQCPQCGAMEGRKGGHYAGCELSALLEKAKP